MGSGTAEIVAPPNFAADSVTKRSAGPKAEAKYRTASGHIVANLGKRIVTRRAEDGEARGMTFQVADVTKPLAPPGRIASRGHRRLLDDDEAYIQHMENKRNVALHKKGNVNVARMEMHATP